MTTYSSREFSTRDPDTVQSSGKTEAGGLGGVVADIAGTNIYYRAGRGQYGQDEAGRLARDRGAQEASRGGEAQFTNYLMDAAQGRGGPSVAQQQLAQSTGRAEQAVSARAASARGPNRALAMRDALGAQSQLRGEANAQAAVQRAQEQMAREQLVAEQLRQRRLMDLQQQGLTLDEANAKLQAEMQSQQINADIAKANSAAAGQGFGAIMSAASGLASMSDIRNKRDITPLEMPQKAPALIPESSGDSGGSVNAGAIMGMLSDRRAKELVVENATLKEALRAAAGASQAKSPGVDLRPVRGYRFNYSDPNAPGAAEGPQVGGMAHEIAASDAAPAVKNTPRGQMVDTGRLTMALAPAVGEEQRRGDAQDQRISGLEQALRATLQATRGGSYSDEPMELGMLPGSPIHRPLDAVPGETNEERLERELLQTLGKRADTDKRAKKTRRSDAERIVRGGDRIVGANDIYNRYQLEPDLAALDAASIAGGITPTLGESNEELNARRQKRAGGMR